MHLASQRQPIQNDRRTLIAIKALFGTMVTGIMPAASTACNANPAQEPPEDLVVPSTYPVNIFFANLMPQFEHDVSNGCVYHEIRVSLLVWVDDMERFFGGVMGKDILTKNVNYVLSYDISTRSVHEKKFSLMGKLLYMPFLTSGYD